MAIPTLVREPQQRADNKARQPGRSLSKQAPSLQMEELEESYQGKGLDNGLSWMRNTESMTEEGALHRHQPSRGLVVQPKLSVGQPGDRFEQEADALADRWIETGRVQATAPGTGAPLSPTLTPLVQGSGSLETSIEPGSQFEEQLTASGASGSPLPDTMRGQMEQGLGADLGTVRVHTGPEAVQMNRMLQSNAFTHGNHLYFNEGRYQPEQEQGQRLIAHEVTHVLQQGGAQGAVQMEGGVTARYPTLETWAVMNPDFASIRSFPLTSSQMEEARSVFGNSLLLEQVTIEEALIINAPTTFGSAIRIEPGYVLDNRTLIHELMHVWQYQVHGSGYISASVNCQVGAIITEGDRGAAYDYDIVPGQSIEGYNPEQQATIVEHYYAYEWLREDPEYQRLIEEVRSATPSITTSAEAIDQILGPTARQPEPFSQVMGGNEDFFMPGGGIPQLEFRF